MAVVGVALLSIGVGASAMGGIESYASAIGGGESYHSYAVGSEGYAKAESRSSMEYKRVDVGKFDKIEISGLVAVEYQQGMFPGYVELETQPGYMSTFEVVSKDGTLKLGCHQLNENNSKLTFVVRVTAPNLKEVKMEGVTSFKVGGTFSFNDDFQLNTGGVNTVSFGEVTGKKMTIKANGVSTISMLSAYLRKLDVISNGVSDMRLKGLNVDNIYASVETASSIVLSGRCRSITKKENFPAKIDTKGLIVESASSHPSQSGSMTMPRIP